jgi:hypothetical protein
MTAGDIVALVGGVAAAVAAGALVATAASLRRAVADLRAAADELGEVSMRLITDAHRNMEQMGDLLGAAESVTATVDSASKLAYTALSSPVVKAMAFGTGTARAARRLRGNGRR